MPITTHYILNHPDYYAKGRDVFSKQHDVDNLAQRGLLDLYLTRFLLEGFNHD